MITPIQKLPAKPIDEILEELRSINERQIMGDTIETPKIMIALKNGNSLLGRVINIVAILEEKHLLFELSSSKGEFLGEVVYCPFKSIEGLRFLDTNKFLSILSFEELDDSELGPPPTKDNVERWVKDLNSRMSRILKKDFVVTTNWGELNPTSSELRYTRKAIFGIFGGAILLISQDQIMSKRFVDGIDEILLEFFHSKQPVKDDTKLRVGIGLNRLLKFGRDELFMHLKEFF